MGLIGAPSPPAPMVSGHKIVATGLLPGSECAPVGRSDRSQAAENAGAGDGQCDWIGNPPSRVGMERAGDHLIQFPKTMVKCAGALGIGY